MTKAGNQNALTHGAFGKFLILPGEDPFEFEEMERGLFAEYKPSGSSEERLIISIAKALWQEQRLGLYEHVQYLRVRVPALKPGSSVVDHSARDILLAAIAKENNAERERLAERYPDRDWSNWGKPKPVAEVAPVVPSSPPKKSDDEALLELGDFATLDHLSKQLDVEAKLHAKIDRLFKRFFQTRAMKQMSGLGEIQESTLIADTPMLELTAVDTTIPPDVPSDSPASDSIDPILQAAA